VDPRPKKLEKCNKDIEEIEIEADMLIEIPGGRFRMGLERELADEISDKEGWLSNDLVMEMPAHWVEVAPFQISQTPVTNAEYAEFVNAGGYQETRLWKAIFEEAGFSFERIDFEEWFEMWKRRENPVSLTWYQIEGPSTWKNGKPPPGKELHPVSGVSWYEAAVYCAFKGWRLPTEAEWEFAARGTDGRIYPWGNEFDPCLCANKESNGSDTVPVNTMLGGQSPFGVLHMSGNVAEWVSGYFEFYPGANVSESTANEYKRQQITRNTFGGFPEILRASYRVPWEGTSRWPGLGFRCAK
jgi:formylglycine-generating enzyme required for sulfatase activity